MGTFNAGAIEAKLTLDRSAFNREMREARAEAQRMQQEKIRPELQLRGREKLDQLAAQLKKLDGDSVDIRLDTSGTAVEDIKRLEAQIKRMSGKDVDIDTDVSGLDDLAALEALIEEMDPSEIHLDLNIDRAVTFARGHRLSRLYARSLADWRAELESLGFEVDSRDMSGNKPLANVMLYCRVR